jgi:hypothetical protein
MVSQVSQFQVPAILGGFQGLEVGSGQIMRTVAAIVFLVALTFTHQALGFGANGHRVVGKIAEAHLTENAQAMVTIILDGEPLARAATWPDEMRSAPDPFWKDIAAKWHFVNVPEGQTYEASDKEPKGDANVALHAFTAILRGETLEDGPMKQGLNQFFGDIEKPENQKGLKAFALRFLVHILGDIHQPLHTGYKKDRGGNSIKVEFFGEPTNLHSVWDTDLVEAQQLSFSELASFVDISDADQIRELQESEPIDWLHESLDLRKTAYDVADGKFSYGYTYDNVPIIESQLRKAGIRTAGLLNDIFAE